MVTPRIALRKHQRVAPLGGCVQLRGVDWLRPQRTFFSRGRQLLSEASRTLLVNMGRGDLSG